MARHCFMRRHTTDVDLLPTALTEVIETREVSAEQVASSGLA
jgi:hypothetical protein